MDESKKFEKPEKQEEGMEDLVKTIQEKRLDALPYLTDKLKIDIEDYYRDYDYSKVECVVKKLMDREEKKEKYTEVVNAVAELYADADKNNEEFQGWSHSLCHLFEHYNPDDPHYSSLLKPRFLKTSEKLVTECASRGLEANKPGCMDRIIEPIIEYNFSNIKTKEDLDRYNFKPEALSERSEELARLFEYERRKTIADFLMTETPKDYILKRMERKKELFYERPEKTVKMLNFVKEDISTEKMNSYLGDVYNINIQDFGGKNIAETLKIMKENIEKSKEVSEEVEGVFIDVEGTIIINGRLNEVVLNTIEEEAGKGRDIIVFTGGDSKKQTEILRKLGFPEKYLPVKNKKDYAGKKLEYLIDDTEPVYQGFKFSSYWKVEPETKIKRIKTENGMETS